MNAPQRHPLLHSGHPVDWSSKGAADALCIVIADFWRAKGYAVALEVVPDGHDRKGHNPIWGIRSDLIGGLPSKKFEPARTRSSEAPRGA